MAAAKKVSFDSKTDVKTFVGDKPIKERKRPPKESLDQIPFDDLFALSKKERTLAISAMTIDDRIKFYTGLNDAIGYYCLYFSHAAFSEFVRARTASIRDNPRFETEIFKSGVLQFAIEDFIINFIHSANKFASAAGRKILKVSDIKALVDILNLFNTPINIPQFEDLVDDGEEVDSTEDDKKSPIQALAGKPVITRLAYAADTHTITKPTFRKLHDIIIHIVDKVVQDALTAMDIENIKTLKLDHFIVAINSNKLKLVNQDNIFKFKDD